MSKVKPSYVIGSVVVVAFGAFALITFRSTVTPYVSFDEAMKSGASVQVIGEPVAGSIVYDVSHGRLLFDIEERDTGKHMRVSYLGVQPSNMDRATEIVVIGAYAGGEFAAEQVLVKCPSKYIEGGA